MNKILAFLACVSLVGAGCVNSPFSAKDDVSFGTSRFGRVSDVGEAILGGWVRPFPGPFWWDKIEVSSGTFDWSTADATVTESNGQNQALLATIWPFAEWDQTTCHGAESTVEHPFSDAQVHLMGVCNVEAYQRFVTAVIERYDGDGNEDMPGLTRAVTHWQIGSEPDVQTNEEHYYQSGPFAYAETLQLSFDAIKAADPNAQVIVAGQSSLLENGTSFFRQVLPFAREKFDIAAVQSSLGEDDLNASAYRAFINGLGFDSKPVWITDVEIVSPDPAVPFNEDEAARVLFTTYVSAFANGAERIFGRASVESNVQASYKLLVDTIDHFDKAERVGDNIVLFTVGDRSIFALWNGATLPGDYQEQQVEILRYDGTREKVAAKELKADVPLFVFVD